MPNDSTWERDPDAAFSAVMAAIAQDERHGYLNKVQVRLLTRTATRLRNKGRKAQR